ncbi:c-type cytochrome [Oceanisphaera arctica]|uniref:Cytochrome c4 n=1 Tax=Oceanisphaera arctica TaxID=641510 RepID=A0A2P5TNS6_9GAMM|nr:c-type cytochrome [Oceanisphaera arctica]PPL17263.1 cytochrome c4 [Oceanisphaera arctica]GHA20162.1 cystathionine beta-synthase [Oceanisphaera arctica]
MKKSVLLASALVMNALPAAAEMPPQAAVCVSCHQASGLGMPNLAPSIAGMPASYLAAQLQHFKSGERNNAIMQPMAMMLDDAGIKATSEWFASLPVELPDNPAFRGQKSPQQMTDGEKLAYLGDWQRDLPSCVACHGPEGVGVGESFPRLAGQHADYIESQLKAWQAGTRSGDTHGLMASVANKLTAEEITAVASYFASVGAK